LSDTDIFDPLVLFERNYFEDDNTDDGEWNIFGIAYPNISGKKKYNDFDGIDDIYPWRKVKISINGIKSVVFNEVLFYKCYAEAALFVEYEVENPEIMEMKIPIYISEKVIGNVEELYNGKEIDALIFGNINLQRKSLPRREAARSGHHKVGAEGYRTAQGRFGSTKSGPEKNQSK